MVKRFVLLLSIVMLLVILVLAYSNQPPAASIDEGQVVMKYYAPAYEEPAREPTLVWKIFPAYRETPVVVPGEYKLYIVDGDEGMWFTVDEQAYEAIDVDDHVTITNGKITILQKDVVRDEKDL